MQQENHRTEGEAGRALSRPLLFLVAVNTAVILTGIIYRLHGLETIPAFGGDEAKLICEMDEPGIGWTIHIHYIGFYLEAVTNPLLLLFGFSGFSGRLSPACAGIAAIFACALWAILHQRRLPAKPIGNEKELRILFVLTSTACTASLPLLFVYSRILFPHGFFPVFLIGALILLEHSLGGRPYLFVLSGLLIGIAFGFHPLPVLCLPPFLAVFCWANRARFRLWHYLAFSMAFLIPALPTISSVFVKNSEWPRYQSPLSFLKTLWFITVGQQSFVYINGTGFSHTEVVAISGLLALTLAGAMVYWVQNKSDIALVGHFWIFTVSLVLLYLMTRNRPLSNDGYERYTIGVIAFLPLILGKSVLARDYRQGIGFACAITMLNLMLCWGNVGRFITSFEEIGGQSHTYFRNDPVKDPREKFFQQIAEEAQGSDGEIVAWEWNAYWAFKYYCRKYRKNFAISMGYPAAWEQLKNSHCKYRYVILYADSDELRRAADALVAGFFEGNKLARYPLEQASGEVYLHAYRILNDPN
ncbi:MAG: hypothetical protein O3B01_05045 [Planctomycetota bacterium]|nr:hypothetical protein [Planctomycetota bacterium]